MSTAVTASIDKAVMATVESHDRAAAASPAAATAPTELPSHTLQWDAKKRAQYAPYVAARETPHPSPTPRLQSGDVVIVDCGRTRDLVELKDGKSVKMARMPLQVHQLIGDEVGRWYAIQDRQGNISKRKGATQPQQGEEEAEDADETESSKPQQQEEEADALTDERYSTSPSSSTPPAAPSFSTSTSSIPTVSSSAGRLLVSSSLPASLIPSANNSALFDKNDSQRLTQAAINAAKSASSTTAPHALIELLVDNSATFTQKTEFSQEKYIARKKRKHAVELYTLEANTVNCWDTQLTREPARLLHMRVDTLAALLQYGDVRAGQYVMCVESTHGSVLGAMAKRMGGDGLLLNVVQQTDIRPNCPLQSLPLPNPVPFGCMKGALTADEQSIALSVPYQLLQDDALLQRLAAADEVHAYSDAAQALSEGVDSLVVCSKLDCVEVLSVCFPFLRPGGSFVVHCGFAAPLASLHRTLRMNGLAVRVELTEAWYREYQVLTNRTHPHVNQSHNAGYLLAGVKTAA